MLLEGQVPMGQGSLLFGRVDLRHVQGHTLHGERGGEGLSTEQAQLLPHLLAALNLLSPPSADLHSVHLTLQTQF